MTAAAMNTCKSACNNTCKGAGITAYRNACRRTEGNAGTAAAISTCSSPRTCPASAAEIALYSRTHGVAGTGAGAGTEAIRDIRIRAHTGANTGADNDAVKKFTRSRLVAEREAQEGHMSDTEGPNDRILTWNHSKLCFAEYFMPIFCTENRGAEAVPGENMRKSGKENTDITRAAGCVAEGSFMNAATGAVTGAGTAAHMEYETIKSPRRGTGVRCGTEKETGGSA